MSCAVVLGFAQYFIWIFTMFLAGAAAFPHFPSAVLY